MADRLPHRAPGRRRAGGRGWEVVFAERTHRPRGRLVLVEEATGRVVEEAFLGAEPAGWGRGGR